MQGEASGEFYAAKFIDQKLDSIKDNLAFAVHKLNHPKKDLLMKKLDEAS
jgi:hypothetical protein